MKLNAEFTSHRLTESELFERLAELPAGGVGFWRLLDQQEPSWLPEEPLPAESGNGVFYEAQLYFEGRMSVEIRLEEGLWRYNEVCWKDIPPRKSGAQDEFQCYTLLARKHGDECAMCYCRAFREVEEDKFMTLKPGWNAFTGFAAGEEK